MLVLLSLLVLQNIWNVTAAPQPKNTCSYSPNGYPSPLGLYKLKSEELGIMPVYTKVKHGKKILLACPGSNRVLVDKNENPFEKQSLEFNCNWGVWEAKPRTATQDPYQWKCNQAAEGTFKEKGTCELSQSKPRKINFVVQFDQYEVPLIDLCRTTEETPRTLNSQHLVAGYSSQEDTPFVPGRTLVSQHYPSVYEGTPQGFKRFQEVAMVKEHGMEKALKYFGRPESQSFLVPAFVVPLEDFPQLAGLEAPENTILLYQHVLEILHAIHEAIRKVAAEFPKVIVVMKFFSSSVIEAFEEVNLLTPRYLVIQAWSQDGDCVRFLVSNSPHGKESFPHSLCESDCEELGWPKLDPEKGLVKCCRSDDLPDSTKRIIGGCMKNLRGPMATNNSVVQL